MGDWGKYLSSTEAGGRIVAVKITPRSMGHDNDQTCNSETLKPALSIKGEGSVDATIVIYYHDGHGEDWGKYLSSTEAGGRIVAVKITPRSIAHDNDQTCNSETLK